MPTPNLTLQHAALTRGVGFADVSNRTHVEITGKDRVRLLQGLCTNDIQALQVGDGCEAFLTNAQGKTIGYVYVFCGSDGLVVDSASGQSSTIIQSLDRYVIREDVQFHDRATEWCEYLICGQEAPSLLQNNLGVKLSKLFQHVVVEWRGYACRVQRVPFGGSESYFVSTDRTQANRMGRELAAGGGQRCDDETVEVVRIEAGTPLFGADVTPDTLPQEVGRTPQAISFTKGCYLGQETVARIDALGHVNRTLKGIRFHGTDVPAPGSELSLADKVVAHLTSTCWSPRLGAPLALAYVRRGHDQLGARMQSPWGEAEVIQLPLT